STCAANPASVTASGTSAATSTVTLSTTARTWVPFVRRLLPTLRMPGLLNVLVALALMIAAGLLAQRRRLAMSAAVLVLAVVTGCGGVASSTGGGGGTKSGTPAGTFTLTISASSGSLSHNAQVTVVVN